MKHLLLLLSIITCSLQAQVTISGIVKDASTLKPVPFALVTFSSDQVTTSDATGKFEFQNKESNQSFTISRNGYEKQTISTSNKNYFVIALVPKKDILSEDEIALQQLTALNLMKNVVANKYRNNPLIKLENYSCKGYNKLVITANPDSLDGTITSVFNKKRKTYELDSTNYKF